ncbi:MAG TPA: cyclase family protein [Pseudonocardiaceae bacterium]|nr:cyclase family protein [Pseudonocardiaceae bacterium]
MCLSGTLHALHHGPDAAPAHRDRSAGRISRRGALIGAAATAAAVAVPAAPAQAAPRRHGAVRDLTHVFRVDFPIYGGDPPARRTVSTIEDTGFYVQAWSFAEHTGTHLDAPGHVVPGGRLVPELDPEEMFAPLAVVDISRRAEHDPDAMVEVRDLRDYERHHGRIADRAAVCMYSGWERRVHDPAAYRNPDPDGTLHFPGFGLKAVEWLLEKRRIVALGVDTLSLDVGASTTVPVHKRLLGADRYGLENLANLGQIPPRGAEMLVGIVPWEKGSGGPCRVLARW